MMRMARFTVPLAVAAAFALACSGIDGPIDPAPPRPAAGTASFSYGTTSVGDDTVFIMKRQVPLNSSTSVSATVGAAGGEIRIPAAGLKVTFPAGALNAPTVITLTANAGWDASYEFQPHGTHFAVPVRVEQDIRYTLAGRFPELAENLRGSYYEGNLNDDYVDRWHLFAHVKEVHTGTLDRSAHTFSFYVGHFSGWAISTGRSALVDE